MNGKESTVPGSTTLIKDTISTFHDWWTAKFHYTNYFLATRKFHGGFLIEGVASNQDLFNNYISSVIMASAFQPIPESQTYFMPQFRAYNYAAAGLMAVWSMGKNLDLRGEVYHFGAYRRIVNDINNLSRFDDEYKSYFMASTAVVFHSPLGPISVSANYYDRKETPWSILFNFGYIVFNPSVRN
ncbi:MAG: hypothetical protein R2809_12370 [Flavobacteriales bacterium]